MKQSLAGEGFLKAEIASPPHADRNDGMEKLHPTGVDELLEQVAILIAHGQESTGTAWTDDRRYFQFRDTPQARDVLTRYAANDLLLDPTTVFRTFRDARRRRLQAKREAGRLR